MQSEDSIPYMLKHIKAWKEEGVKLIYPTDPKK